MWITQPHGRVRRMFEFRIFPFLKQFSLQKIGSQYFLLFSLRGEQMDTYFSQECKVKHRLIQIFFHFHTHTNSCIIFFFLAYWVECSLMVQETGVQSQVESCQRLKKWYLMLPCLALSTIRLGSRVKWSNPGNGVVPSLTPRCSSYWKGSLRVNID